MSKLRNNPLALTALILTVTVCIALATSFASNTYRDDVTLGLSGYVVREGKQISLDQSVIAKSGENLHYTMNAKNSGEPINAFRAVGQIPAGTVIVPDSIHSNAKIEYSIDGGKSFSAKPQIEVNENGRKKMVDAPVESYNSVAFTLADNFKGQQSMDYEVRVK